MSSPNIGDKNEGVWGGFQHNIISIYMESTEWEESNDAKIIPKNLAELLE